MSVCSECTKTTADSSWNYKNVIFLDIDVIEETNIDNLILENISTVEDNFVENLVEIIDKLNINEEKDIFK